MAESNEYVLARLSTTTSVDMQTTSAKTTLYTVPAGKRMIPIMVVIRDISASLAGCDDVDFGVGSTCSTEAFLNNETGLGDMTATTDYMALTAASDEYTIIDGDDGTLANRQFGIYIVDGATAAATASIDVFGYQFDS